MSLLYTIRALNPEKYQSAVALVQPDPAIRELYVKEGIPVFEAKGLPLFQHSTARWARLSRPRTWLEPFKSMLHWKRAGACIEKVQAEYAPDIIHLNSVVLSPAAIYLMDKGIPFVWHVRESPVPGYFGFRLRFVRRLLRRAGERVIFLSQADKQAWVESSNGKIVHNFIDLERFKATEGGGDRSILGEINPDKPNLLFLGGMTKIKGFMVLLDALKRLKDKGLEVNCLCPGTKDHGARPRGKLVEAIKGILVAAGVQPYWKKCEQRIEALGLKANICRLPFITEIVNLYAISDCLVFPAMEPHFARPVIEAQACGVPVVASRIDGVTELMEGVDCGHMVVVGDAAGLAEALEAILKDHEGNRVRAANGRRNAEDNFDSVKQIMKIEAIYEAQGGAPGCI